MTFEEKIQTFAALVEKEVQEQMGRQYPNISPDVVKVIPGKKYVKVDVGPTSNMSGKYMIDEAGNIFGIKAYGVIHRGHRYGTLDTIRDYYWGGYVGVKKSV